MSRVGRTASRAASKPRALGRALRDQAVGLGRLLREGAGGESRRRRMRWIAVAAVLVIGPLAFNLAREPSYDASVLLFTRPVKPYPAVQDLAYYRRLLDDPELRHQMQLHVGQGVTDYDDITFRRLPRPGLIAVTVESGTPRDAQRVVNALAPQLQGADSRHLGRRADRDAERVRERLLGDSLSAKGRHTLQRRLRTLEQFGEFPPPRILPGAAAIRPRIDSWADELVDDLPGDFQPRPSPVWAALAGLLVAVTLWAICLVLVPPVVSMPRGSARVGDRRDLERG
jgi:hypothetical protein